MRCICVCVCVCACVRACLRACVRACEFFLDEIQSRIYPHTRANFGRGPTVESKKGRGVQPHKL